MSQCRGTVDWKEFPYVVFNIGKDIILLTNKYKNELLAPKSN